jgi:hypothetical protein
LQDEKLNGKIAVESGALSGDTPSLYMSFMIFHDLAANSQSDARARVLIPPVQPLEYLEDPFRLFRFETNAIVGDRKPIKFAGYPTRDPDAQRPFRAPVLDGIADQIDDQLFYLESDPTYGW